MKNKSRSENFQNGVSQILVAKFEFHDVIVVA